MAELSSTDKSVPVTTKKSVNQVQALQEEVNNLFRSFFGDTLPSLWLPSEDYASLGASPATDVIETDDSFKITTELPGMDAKDVSITVSEGFVTIKGEKKEETTEEKNGFFRQERSFGEFKRVIALPPNLTNADKAEASMNKGVLNVTVPKKSDAQSKTRKLDIKQAA